MALPIDARTLPKSTEKAIGSPPSAKPLPISRVQAVRKGWGIAYEAQVRIAVEGGARTGRMVGRFGAQIEEATVSTLGPAAADGERVDVSVDGEDLVIVASRA